MRNVRIGKRLFSKKLKDEREVVSKVKEATGFVPYDSIDLDKIPDNVPPARTYAEEVNNLIERYIGVHPPHWYIADNGSIHVTNNSNNCSIGVTNTFDYNATDYITANDGTIYARRRNR